MRTGGPAGAAAPNVTPSRAAPCALLFQVIERLVELGSLLRGGQGEEGVEMAAIFVAQDLPFLGGRQFRHAAIDLSLQLLTPVAAEIGASSCSRSASMRATGSAFHHACTAAQRCRPATTARQGEARAAAAVDRRS